MVETLVERCLYIALSLMDRLINPKFGDRIYGSIASIRISANRCGVSQLHDKLRRLSFPSHQPDGFAVAPDIILLQPRRSLAYMLDQEIDYHSRPRRQMLA